MSIKSGPNWGNNSQYERLEQNFRKAKTALRAAASVQHTQAVLGICYGRLPTVDNGVYIRYAGQAFWDFLSGDSELYLKIIEPIGYEARKQNAEFDLRRAALLNRFTDQFYHHYCGADGSIDWKKLVVFNSGNLGMGS